MLFAAAPVAFAQDLSPYAGFDQMYLNAGHHMLRKGDDLNYTIDVSQIAGRAATRVGGVSITSLRTTGVPFQSDGQWTVPQSGIDRIRDLKLPLTRTYALFNSSLGFTDPTTAVDRMFEMCQKFGIPTENAVLEPTNKIVPPPAVEAWEAAVRHNRDRKYGFRHWEIGNEPFFNANQFPTPFAFINYVKQVAPAIRAIDPDAQIGINVFQTGHLEEWRAFVMDELAGYYDFVALHSYNAGRELEVSAVEPYEDFVLANNWLMVNEMLQARAILDAFAPQAYIYETEWAMNRKPSNEEITPTTTADWQLVNSELPGTMHRLVRMIYFAQGGFIEGASAWTLFVYTPGRLGFGLVPKFDYSKTTMLYWTYYYFNRHIGPLIPHLDGESPYYRGQFNQDTFPFLPKNLTLFEGPAAPMLATMNEDRSELYIVQVNGLRDEDIPATFTLQGAEITGVEAVLLTREDIEDFPQLDDPADFVRSFEAGIAGRTATFDLPAKSAIFIKLKLDTSIRAEDSIAVLDLEPVIQGQDSYGRVELFLRRQPAGTTVWLQRSEDLLNWRNVLELTAPGIGESAQVERIEDFVSHAVMTVQDSVAVDRLENRVFYRLVRE